MLFLRLRRLSRVQSDSPRGLHGNPRKNLSILSFERLLWKRTLSRICRSCFPFLSYPMLNLSRVFSPRGEAFSTSVGASLATKRKCEDEREGRGKERETESVAVSLKEVYFANKTGPLLCRAYWNNKESPSHRWSERTLQDGAPSWSRQADMPRIRALAAECRLINSDGFIAVILRSSPSPSSPLYFTICLYNPRSTSSCYEQALEIM